MKINKNNNKTNETKMMNCGMEATIIAYRKSNDIDIKFKDGTIIKNQQYSNFTRGNINNPNKIKNERINETKTMNCGMNATIIAYRSADDIDVKFEDCTIVENKSYASFERGLIKNPNINNTIILKTAKLKINETKMMNCGMEATIIAYRRKNDIDIKFKDGTIIENKSYASFKKGLIKNPNIKTIKNPERLGETKMMNCGMEATIITYRGVNDIDVKFKDGTIREHKTYNSFKKGNIDNPNVKRIFEIKDERINETKMMNCKMKATIIAYRGVRDIDVKFEDGTIRKNCRYDHFKEGSIDNPNILNFYEGSLFESIFLFYLKDFGYKKYKKNSLKNYGMGKREIDCFNINENIAIEIDGYPHKDLLKKDLEKNKLFKNNFKGKIIRIRDINIPIIKDNISINYILDMSNNYFSKKHSKYYQTFIKNIIKKELNINIDVNLLRDEKEIKDFHYGENEYFHKRVNETKMMNCRMEATIIAYRGADDIDIKFKDDTIVKNKSYASFERGLIKNPNIKIIKNPERLGETKTMKNGMKATIIAYRGVRDIDVKFEDDTIVENSTYTQFKQNSIKNPNEYNYRINETKIMKNGMEATIIAYRSADDIDIKFKDGTIIKNKPYSAFKKGYIKNPNTKTIKNPERLGEATIAKNGMKATIIAYRGADDIDIEFEDGTIIKNRGYSSFLKKSFEHPSIKNIRNPERLGETRVMKNGMKATIIAYRGADDIDIKFEDGIIKKSRYDHFTKGIVPK